MDDATIIYYGYGLLKDKEFVETLFGRRLKDTEIPMVVKGLELRIVDRDQLPQTVIDNTPQGFRIYGAAWNSESELEVLRLEPSKPEQSAINELNFGDTLFIKGQVGLDDGSLGIIDHLPSPSFGEKTSGVNYNPFLNNRRAALFFARQLHDKHIKPVLEGVLRSSKER